MINVFNPEVIVLGGSLAALWEARQDVVDKTLDRWTLMSPRSEVIIRASALGPGLLPGGARPRWSSRPCWPTRERARPGARRRGPPGSLLSSCWSDSRPSGRASSSRRSSTCCSGSASAPTLVTLVGTLGVAAGALAFYPRGELFVGVARDHGLRLHRPDRRGDGPQVGRSSTFGAFFDSTLDRVGDAAIFGGLALYFAGTGDSYLYLWLSLFCLVVGYLTSYARAKAESWASTPRAASPSGPTGSC